MRLELSILPVFTAIWLVGILVAVEILPASGLLRLDLYRLYGVAAVLGWLAGNVYVTRRRLVPAQSSGRHLLLVYLLGPSGLVYLLRALAPLVERLQAPLVPLYALGVYAVLFFVPVSFRSRPRQPGS